MNSLITLGTSAAYGYSLLVTLAPDVLPEQAREVYFEAVGVILTLILLGRLLETRAKAGTGEAIRKLIGLQPRTARVRRDGGEAEIGVDQVRGRGRGRGPAGREGPGRRRGPDRPFGGGRVDGHRRVRCRSTRRPGDAVIGATVNQTGAFSFRADKVGADTCWPRSSGWSQQAQALQGADPAPGRPVSGYFVPGGHRDRVVTFVVWFVAGPRAGADAARWSRRSRC